MKRDLLEDVDRSEGNPPYVCPLCRGVFRSTLSSERHSVLCPHCNHLLKVNDFEHDQQSISHQEFLMLMRMPNWERYVLVPYFHTSFFANLSKVILTIITTVSAMFLLYTVWLTYKEELEQETIIVKDHGQEREVFLSPGKKYLTVEELNDKAGLSPGDISKMKELVKNLYSASTEEEFKSLVLAEKGLDELLDWDEEKRFLQKNSTSRFVYVERVPGRKAWWNLYVTDEVVQRRLIVTKADGGEFRVYWGAMRGWNITNLDNLKRDEPVVMMGLLRESSLYFKKYKDSDKWRSMQYEKISKFLTEEARRTNKYRVTVKMLYQGSISGNPIVELVEFRMADWFIY